jgi:hypothetical protein
MILLFFPMDIHSVQSKIGEIVHPKEYTAKQKVTKKNRQSHLF